ncbi:two-component regulator propeller domain-containing protein [Marinomonas sp. RSW2]|uniref:diguanylate cyclase n=1 Tax=Marinomonas maritima TaxID=2940935 RepID=A0ABT5WCC4_9GAMM|nr:ligand-binding sensor domain-containing diguanylate cyclase [Marinomonas maritima]MDE8602473.1 two-component regulator propeller domain-containing protein [Marinomonas maritima]
MTLINPQKVMPLWLGIVLICTFNVAHANTPVADYFKDTWSTQEGLPHNSINAIAQTSDGYLWFATWEGVARYNGRDFRFFERSAKTGILDSGIRTLISDDNNGLWVAGARGGITYHQDDHWQPQPAARGMVNHLLKDRSGNVWVAVEGLGVFYRPKPSIDVDSTEEVWVLKNLSVYRLLEDTKGQIWAATDNGLFKLNRDNTQEVLAQYGLSKLHIYSILETQNTGLLVATNRGAYTIKDDKISLLHPSLAGEAITTLMEDDEKDLWLGTVSKGVMRFDKGHIETLNTQSGLPNNRVLSILQDLEGSIWIGTNGGLMRLRKAPFTTWTKKRALVGDYVRSVIDVDAESVLVGSSEGLSLIRNNTAHEARLNSGSPISVLSFAKRREGGIWVGTYLNGLMLWKDNQLSHYLNYVSGLPSDEVRAILEDSHNNLWIGTTNGLVQKTASGQQRLFTRDDGLPDNYIMALTEDDQGQIWVGTGVGVAKLTSNGFEIVPINSQEGAEYAFGFWVEPGYVWIATDRGLIRYSQEDGQLGLVGRRSGLPIDKLFQVIYDGTNGLWLTSNRGIWRVDYHAAHAVADGRQNKIAFEHFSESDGLASAQANGGSNPAAVAMDNGKLWFATAKGVAMVNSSTISQKNTAHLPITIESISADGHVLLANKKNVLPAGTNRVVFNYAGLGYVMSSRIEYRTRLVGFESTWASRGKNTIAEYTNLAPGQYQFLVSARYPYSDWNSADQIYEITILPHFWQRLEVQIGVALLILIILAGSLRWRFKQLQKNELRLQALVEKQTYDLRQQSEDFQRQANEDELTGLPNRRAFDLWLSEGFVQAKQQQTSLILVIMDIDHFKKINDHYSHLVGDQAIKSLAAQLQLIASQQVHVARWGGEEFTLVIEGVDDINIAAHCDNIRQSIETFDYSNIATDFKMTVSMGVAFAHSVESYQGLLRLADQALYRAKKQGRNRVEIWQE